MIKQILIMGFVLATSTFASAATCTDVSVTEQRARAQLHDGQVCTSQDALSTNIKVTLFVENFSETYTFNGGICFGAVTVSGCGYSPLAPNTYDASISYRHFCSTAQKREVVGFHSVGPLQLFSVVQSDVNCNFPTSKSDPGVSWTTADLNKATQALSEYRAWILATVPGAQDVRIATCSAFSGKVIDGLNTDISNQPSCLVVTTDTQENLDLALTQWPNGHSVGDVRVNLTLAPSSPATPVPAPAISGSN